MVLVSPIRTPNKNESGNILLYVLIAIVLIGLLTFALRDNGGTKNNVDSEAASVKAGQIISYGSELAQAVNTLLKNGVSENDIRFAHPNADPTYGIITTNPQNQIFSSQGGNAVYRLPPANSNDASKWVFNADGAVFQGGSNKADLTAGLSYVTDDVCKAINRQLSLSDVLTSTNCLASPTLFIGTFATSPTAMTWTPAPTQPVLQACISCDYGSGVIVNSYYYTLLAR